MKIAPIWRASFYGFILIFLPGEAFLVHVLFNKNVSPLPLSKGSGEPSNESWRHQDPAYLKALQEAAKDPKTFEQFIAKQQEEDIPKEENVNEIINGLNSSDKKRGYVPIEQWDQQQKELLKEMTWEQRVQYDGQRNGNQWRQNEILRKNLKIF